MCLAVPGRVVSLDPEGATARVDVAGAQRDVCTLLLGEPTEVGHWVLVHVGFAMARLDEDEALRSLTLLSDALDADPSHPRPSGP